MTCRQCGKEIIIQGPRASGQVDMRSLRPRQSSSQAVQLPSSVLASDFRKQLVAAPRERPVPMAAMAQWHVAIADVPVGPMRLEEVSRKIATGAVGPESLVWREGLDDWMPANKVPEIAALLATAQAPGSLRPAGYHDHQRGGAQTLDAARIGPHMGALPIGGRLGADVPMTSEEYLPLSPPSETYSEELPLAPVGRMQEITPARNLFQSWGVMFVMVCGGAFIMMIGVVLGVKYLGSTERLERVTTTVEKNGPSTTTVRREESGGVVVLETQEIDGQLTTSKGLKKTLSKGTTGQTADSKSGAKNGKDLSSQEKDMLARMGGGLDRVPAELQTSRSTNETASSSGRGGLKAEQLASVVSRGKMELQRCYESALRLNPSTQTIRLDVDITVGLSGSVTGVKTRGKGLGDMEICIARTVRMWRFPNASEETRTTFPVVFQPGA
jgi:hypothetical protein